MNAFGPEMVGRTAFVNMSDSKVGLHPQASRKNFTALRQMMHVVSSEGRGG